MTPKYNNVRKIKISKTKCLDILQYLVLYIRFCTCEKTHNREKNVVGVVLPAIRSHI